MSTGVSVKSEGRVGDPSLELATDPRFNPVLLKALTTLGIHHNVPAGKPDDRSIPAIELSPAMKGASDGFKQIYGNVGLELPEDASAPKLIRSKHIAKADDGHDIALHVFRKAGTEGKALPAIIYTHGGGMVILETEQPHFVHWVSDLAQEDVVAILLDFRNAWTPSNYNPFPTGLRDCVAGVKHIAAHRSKLGISKITLHGESGGGNLAIATALSALKEGWIDQIAGVYASVPYISGAYGRSDEWKARNLPSTLTNNGYFIDMASVSSMARYYGPEEKDAEDPLAWPYWASVEELRGLPPCFISVDELDPLRDEGIAFHRKLLQAGVPATGIINLGLVHAAVTIWRVDLKEQRMAAVRSITGFAKSV